MDCPYCSYDDSKVIDSRDVNGGIRRRRQCLQCGSRFTTYERIQSINLFVIKRDRRREEFSQEKLLSGIRKACEKRPLPNGAVDRLSDDIEAALYRLSKTEVPSTVIGDMVMSRLKKIDHIAYIRYASVYRKFADISTLKEEVDTLASNHAVLLSDQLPLIPSEELEEMMKIQPKGGG